MKEQDSTIGISEFDLNNESVSTFDLFESGVLYIDDGVIMY